MKSKIKNGREKKLMPNFKAYTQLTFRLILLVSLALFSGTGFHAALAKPIDATTTAPKELRVPGGIALVPFKYRGRDLPLVKLNDQRVMVIKQSKNRWLAIVGIPLKAQKTQTLNINGKEKIFNVSDKDYDSQYITLKNKSQVNPALAQLERIGKESSIMKKVFRSWSVDTPSQLQFDLPVQGPISSTFGLKRFFNNEPRKPHSGLDIAAPAGSKIINPSQGKVAAVGDYFFNGNTVLIDHGQGMISMYCHMQSVNVSLGQSLAAGDLVGAVGQTGRATGPHLHWSVSLNNTRVDPNLFLLSQ